MLETAMYKVESIISQRMKIPAKISRYITPRMLPIVKCLLRTAWRLFWVRGPTEAKYSKAYYHEAFEVDILT